MLFERVYDEGLAQASYFIGCQRLGEAVVVDPRRDIEIYLRMAAEHGMRIVAVTETHIHADYLSGSRELAESTGATLYVSGEGDELWRYAFASERLRDGDEVRVGNIVLKAVHTPGHTPEHLSFSVTDGATTDETGFLLTGDFVFVGDVGRPDLLDEVAGGRDSRFAGARAMFGSLKEKFLSFPDYVQVWPGHGSGSACGKALGSVPVTTVGYERRHSWWGWYVETGDEDGFVEALLADQPDAPAYFGRMKRLNREGAEILGQRQTLRRLPAEEVRDRSSVEEVVLLDTREAGAHRANAVVGSLHAPSGRKFAERAAWVYDPEVDPAVMLIAEDGEEAETLRGSLVRVGIDRVEGYVTSTEGFPTKPAKVVRPEDIREDDFLLDVRTRAEYEGGSIPGATRIPGGAVRWRLDEIPTDRRVVVYCQSGARSAVVASLLRFHGYGDVVELDGGYPAWTHARRAVVAR